MAEFNFFVMFRRSSGYFLLVFALLSFAGCSDASSNLSRSNQQVTQNFMENFSDVPLESAQTTVEDSGGGQRVDAFGKTIDNAGKIPSADELKKGSAGACLNETVGDKAFECFDKYLTDKTLATDPVTAFKDLRGLYEMSSMVQTYCHPLSHSIGHAAVEKYPKVADAYTHGEDFCWSGYYHGVIERYIGKIGYENLPGEINNICMDIPGKESYSFDYYNCVHGVGHGLMSLTGDELFDSLELCDGLTGQWEKSSCYSGVFMENVIADGRNHKTDYLKPEDPVYPCNAVGEGYKETCYLMQTSYMLKVTNYDFKKVFDLCKGVDAGYVNTCYRSLGRDASGTSVSDVEQTKTKCFIGENFEQKSECIVGAVKDFISYYYSDTKAKQLCQSLGDAQMEKICLETADEYYSYFAKK